MNRFSRDFALIRSNGTIIIESNDIERLKTIQNELAEEGIVSTIVVSDLPSWRTRVETTATLLRYFNSN